MSSEAIDPSVIIDRPIMEVFDYVADVDRLREWIPFYSDARILTKRPDGYAESFLATVGVSVLKREIVVQVETVRGRRLTYRSVLGQVASCEFESCSRGTIVRTAQSMQALVLGPLSQLFRPFTHDVHGQVLLGLKKQLEGSPTRSAPLIFFCYRRSQAEFVAGRIYDNLCTQFGAGAVFFDRASTLGGAHWRDNIEKALEECEVVVAHIADKWEDEIKNRWEGDVLREELQKALKYGALVVPVFTTSKERTSLDERLKEILAALPDGEIKEVLRKRQGLLLRKDPDFRKDMDEVTKTVWDQITSGRGKMPIGSVPSVR